MWPLRRSTTCSSTYRCVVWLRRVRALAALAGQQRLGLWQRAAWPTHESSTRLIAALLQDATRILREIKLLRQLKHPDIVEIKHILLPPHPREFKDIFVVFELMETDLHQVGHNAQLACSRLQR